MRRPAAFALGLLLTLALAPRSQASAWEHPDFAAGTNRPRRIVILPAQAEMTRARLIDAMPFIKETKALEDALRRESAASLTGLGYSPDLESLSPDRIAQDRELQALVRELEQQVGGIVDVASGKPKDIGRGRFSVGEAVLPLASRTGAEAFLWLQSSSVVPSKGQRTLASIFAVLSGTPNVPVNQTQLVAVLVDARTGDLASIAASVAGGAVLKEPERVAAHVVGEVFAQWPSATTARKVSAKRVAAAEAARVPEVPLAGESLDELTVIGRFEEAVARLEGGVVAGIPEDVVTRAEFTDAGAPIAANGAASAEPVVLFEPRSEPAEPAAAPPAERAPAAAPAPAPQAPRTAAPSPAPAAPPAPVTPPREPPVVASRPAPATSPAAPAAAPAIAASRAPLPAPAPATAGVASPHAVWDVPAGTRPTPSRQLVFQMTEGRPGLVVRNVAPPAVLVSVDLGAWTRLAMGEQASFDVGSGNHRILVASVEGVELGRANVLVGAMLANAEIWNF